VYQRFIKNLILLASQYPYEKTGFTKKKTTLYIKLDKKKREEYIKKISKNSGRRYGLFG
jgi:hypothetical protein